MSIKCEMKHESNKWNNQPARQNNNGLAITVILQTVLEPSHSSR